MKNLKNLDRSNNNNNNKIHWAPIFIWIAGRGRAGLSGGGAGADSVFIGGTGGRTHKLLKGSRMREWENVKEKAKEKREMKEYVKREEGGRSVQYLPRFTVGLQHQQRCNSKLPARIPARIHPAVLPPTSYPPPTASVGGWQQQSRGFYPGRRWISCGSSDSFVHLVRSSSRRS